MNGMTSSEAELYLPDLEAKQDRGKKEAKDFLNLLEHQYDHNPENVLDIACGIGRHVIGFAECGVKSTGVDLRTEFIDKAENWAEEEGVSNNTEFVQGDMRYLDQVDLEEEYDLITCVYTSFGFFEDSVNRQVISDLSKRLSKDGILLIESLNKEYRLVNYSESWVIEQNKSIFAVNSEYNPINSRMDIKREVFTQEDNSEEYGHLGTQEVNLRVYSPVEFRNMFDDAGLTARLYGNTDADKLTLDHSRVICIGKNNPSN